MLCVKKKILWNHHTFCCQIVLLICRILRINRDSFSLAVCSFYLPKNLVQKLLLMDLLFYLKQYKTYKHKLEIKLLQKEKTIKDSRIFCAKLFQLKYAWSQSYICIINFKNRSSNSRLCKQHDWTRSLRVGYSIIKQLLHILGNSKI